MAKTKAERLRARLATQNKRVDAAVRERDQTAEELRRCEQSEIRWTSHGLMRYLTRVKGVHIDEEALLAEVVTDELQELVITLGGTGRFPCGPYTLILKQHDIVTVLTKEEPDG